MTASPALSFPEIKPEMVLGQDLWPVTSVAERAVGRVR